jgi:hypothetical protein
MNNDVAALGGVLFFVAIAFGILLLILWTILPIYLIWKLGDLGYKLDKIEFQIKQHTPKPETSQQSVLPPAEQPGGLKWALLALLAILIVFGVGLLVKGELVRQAPKTLEHLSP